MLHDLENQLEHLIEDVGERLRELFDSTSVAYTPEIYPDTVDLLKVRGYSTLKANKTVVGYYQTAHNSGAPVGGRQHTLL